MAFSPVKDFRYCKIHSEFGPQGHAIESRRIIGDRAAEISRHTRARGRRQEALRGDVLLVRGVIGIERDVISSVFQPNAGPQIEGELSWYLRIDRLGHARAISTGVGILRVAVKFLVI